MFWSTVSAFMLWFTSPRKPCSGHKLKEITGSGIFAANGESDASESGANPSSYNRTGLRMYQVYHFLQDNVVFLLLFED